MSNGSTNNADEFKNFFGGHSFIGNNLINALASKLSTSTNNLIKAKFLHWKVFFDYYYSDNHIAMLKKEYQKFYNLPNSPNIPEISFAIQTYFAIFLKILGNCRVSDYNKDQSNSSKLQIEEKTFFDLKDYLTFIESGGYCTFFLKNFIGRVNFYDWYLLDWDTSIETIIQTMHKKILEIIVDKDFQYTFDPDEMFKILYQDLLPLKVRKLQGEVYTPNWFTEFLLNNSDWNENPNVNILDPSCGSGTFLIKIIQKLRNNSKFNDSKNLLYRFAANNITGYDINPIAVLTARTNFLLAILDLFPDTFSPIIAPIYLRDTLFADTDENQEGIRDIFDQQEHQKFDIIVGNPPWISWEFIPKWYKQRGLKKWQKYDLLATRKMGRMLGEGKFDISAFFVYTCIEEYLKDNGILIFILPSNLLQGGSSKGFRKFFYSENGEKIPFELQKIYDLRQLEPFWEAQQKTVVMKFRKGSETTYPVSVVTLEKVDDSNDTGREGNVKECFKNVENISFPINADEPGSNLLITDVSYNIEQLHKNVFKLSDYKAFEGSNTEGLNTAYWITNLKKTQTGISFQNYVKFQRKKILPDAVPIEPDLIYPLVRSGNIQKWSYFLDTFIIFTLKYDESHIITNTTTFQQKYPCTYQYFISIEPQLLQRASFQGKSKKYPFYVLYGKESMKSNYKVLWNRIGHEITAVVTEPIYNSLLGLKAPIPQETIAYIPTLTLEEAHYICAIMNSQLFSKLLSMVQTKGTKGFGTPDILKKIYIPQYDASSQLHKELSTISMNIHNDIHHQPNKTKIL